AFAQTSHPTTANPAPAAANKDATMNRNATANQAVETIQADQIRASKMIGSTVYDVQNRNIGKVRDLVLDKDGKIAAVVVDVGTTLAGAGFHCFSGRPSSIARNSRSKILRHRMIARSERPSRSFERSAIGPCPACTAISCTRTRSGWSIS